MNLGNPDARRGLRSIVQALLVVALLITVWANIDKLDPDGVRYILGWAMVILLIGTLGYIMENGLRSVNFKGWGAEASATGADAPAAAQAVADSAQATADDVKDAAQ